MRTKALVCAALVAAGAISAVAQQNVYSLNIVGYVNVTVPSGYSLLANPLTAGVTNGANEIMTVPPDAVFLTWNGVGFNAAQYSSIFGWVDPATLDAVPIPQLPPGKGFFYNAPTAQTITFVGQVVPNPNTTNTLNIPVGYSLVGSPMPVSATDITAAPVRLPLVPDMVILKWAGNKFNAAQYSSIFGWVNPETLEPVAIPGYNVGEGFFINTPSATAWQQWLP